MAIITEIMRGAVPARRPETIESVGFANLAKSNADRSRSGARPWPARQMLLSRSQEIEHG